MSVNALSIVSRTAAFGLGAAALVSLGLARPAAAQAPPPAAASHNYIYTVAFNTPSQFLKYTTGDISSRSTRPA